MYLTEKKMMLEDAKKISAWSYPKPYELYSFDGSVDVISELLGGEYKSVYSDKELFGYCCIGKSAQVPIKESVESYNALDAIDVGLGMKPCNTARGLGREFVDFILSCVRRDYPSRIIRLTVASFNKRAIKVYSSLGFKKTHEFIRPQNKMEFIIMILKP